ncbi:MAG: PQQ-binding-like beta-propeller repeat protein [Myxococcales bacterium]|nr:PQQ-binding-like beta-propeller repeat protein [Myxococcales bacterium]
MTPPRRAPWIALIAALALEVGSGLAQPAAGAGPTAAAPAAPTFGVRWRQALPRTTAPHRAQLAIIGDTLLIGDGATIRARRADGGAPTGRGARARLTLAHDALLAGDGVALVRTRDALIALDPITLRPRWRVACAPMTRTATAGPWVVERSRGTLTLRRAGDGAIAWTAPLPFGDLHGVAIDDGTLYVQLLGEGVVAFDVATGHERWRAADYLGNASGGRVAINVGGATTRILLADGTEARRLDHAWAYLDGDTAFVMDAAGVAALELPSGATAWRHPHVGAVVAADAARVYVDERAPDGPRALVALDRATGAEGGRVIIGDGDGDLPWPAWRPGAGTRVVIAFGDRWLLGLGDRAAPERARLRTVRGRVRIHGCRAAAPVAGATVAIAGVRAISDRAGRFRVRVPTTRAPVAVRVETERPLDSPFPTAALLDGARLDLDAGWLGAGCHDE